MKKIGIKRIRAGFLRWFVESAARDRGATATEYAILVALIAIVIVAGVSTFGIGLNGWFSNMAAQLP